MYAASSHSRIPLQLRDLERSTSYVDTFPYVVGGAGVDDPPMSHNVNAIAEAERDRELLLEKDDSQPVPADVLDDRLTIWGARPSLASAIRMIFGPLSAERQIVSMCCSPPDRRAAFVDCRSFKRGK
jgi:hypothetical protein